MKRETIQLAQKISKLFDFNPLPHEEGDGFSKNSFHISSDFNPLPHEEGDFAIRRYPAFFMISIHSLMKRETQRLGIPITAKQFQSTPSRRGRLNELYSFAFSQIFQSTPSRRGRLVNLDYSYSQLCISIHSLKKRETLSQISQRLKILNFNPLPQEEGDGCCCSAMASFYYFNPLPQEEGDFFWSQSDHLTQSFQSTPSRRGRLCIKINVKKKREDFNPLPQEEGDCCRCITRADRLHFNPLPQEEGDRKKFFFGAYQRNFNPLPQEEGDRCR